MVGYIPRLDTFRAIAALSVIYGHFFGSLMPNWLPALNPSGIGVRFFFALSGFLITGVLLTEAMSPAAAVLKRFYIRRAARIFPLYYLTLLIGVTFNVPDYRGSIAWTATYLSNIYLLYVEGAKLGYAGHFWTLAVEEQFYLIWPALLLFFRSQIWWIALSLIAASILHKYLTYPAGYPIASVSPLACADALCIGALVAIAGQRIGFADTERLLRWALPLSAPATLMSCLYHEPTSLAFSTAAETLFFAWLIAGAARDGPHGNSWGGTWLPAIGVVSYGIYVYHFLVLGLIRITAVPDPTWSSRILATTITFGLAWLSWQYFEEPVRRRGRTLADSHER
jgi:peptidoglycan/LPS O-acetylase OafA/YrhL